MIFNNPTLDLMYFNLDEAAQELARTRHFRQDEEWQQSVCRKHGFDLDDMSDCEFDELQRLVDQYCRTK